MNDEKKEMESLSAPFRELIGNERLSYNILDMLPVPMEIFSPDGTCIFLNKAMLKLSGITNAELIVGKYNLLNDQICRKICGNDAIDRVFRGEELTIFDFHAPIQDMVNRGLLDKKPWDAATLDIFVLPLWDDGIFTCTILLFTVKNIYQGREDIVKAQQYMDNHWREDFDLKKVAQSANLSHRHFQRIFKETTGSSPFEYYQMIKIEMIKEKLLDGRLRIEEAFEACGADYRGKTYLNLFKEITQMTPAEFRKEKMSQSPAFLSQSTTDNK